MCGVRRSRVFTIHHGGHVLSIDPTAITSIITFSPKLYDAEGAENAASGPPDGPEPVPPADDLDAIEQRFSAMVSNLTKQVASLERSFTRAMRDLVKGFRAAAAPRAPAAQRSPVTAEAAATSGKFAGQISAAAKRHELDPALLSAVVGQESGFQPRAVSGAGAMGLMQLMPETARALGVRDPFDPAQNVDGGAKYLRGLIDRYRGRLDLALAAYNAGPGAVDRFGAVPPYPETQAYVKNILATYRNAALAS
jgi:soluble lytic murein transglycosylase-like protein